MKYLIIVTKILCVALLATANYTESDSPCGDKDTKIIEELIVLKGEVSIAVKEIATLQNELNEYRLAKKGMFININNNIIIITNIIVLLRWS